MICILDPLTCGFTKVLVYEQVWTPTILDSNRRVIKRFGKEI